MEWAIKGGKLCLGLCGLPFLAAMQLAFWAVADGEFFAFTLLEYLQISMIILIRWHIVHFTCMGFKACAHCDANFDLLHFACFFFGRHIFFCFASIFIHLALLLMYPPRQTSALLEVWHLFISISRFLFQWSYESFSVPVFLVCSVPTTNWATFNPM